MTLGVLANVYVMVMCIVQCILTHNYTDMYKHTINHVKIHSQSCNDESHTIVLVCMHEHTDNKNFIKCTFSSTAARQTSFRKISNDACCLLHIQYTSWVLYFRRLIQLFVCKLTCSSKGYTDYESAW